MSELDDDDPFPEPVEIEITDVFDLHTIPPRDVKRVVEEYLLLARTNFVLDWTDAPPEAGGLGATIVRLKAV